MIRKALADYVRRNHLIDITADDLTTGEWGVREDMR
jgi:hypothetical protein